MYNFEMKNKFYEALENHDLESLSEIPKSDLHNHAGRGGNIKDLSSEIKPPSKPFEDLNEMQYWFENNVKTKCLSGVDGFLYRVEASFKQAANDNIQKLALSFGIGDILALGGMEKFTNVMDTFKKKHIPTYEFMPELSLLRSAISENEIANIKDLMSFGWFKSLDVCGNELAFPIDKYITLYKHAKAKGLLLKIHVGEFGTANDVRNAVELLELDEVHHGIAASASKDVMAYLRKNKVILNVCPMSNIMLKRTNDYSTHPIRQLYDAGVDVTINTDDLAIFNASVSDEYMNLYKNKVFSRNELNDIRIGGLTSYNKYK